MPDVGEFLNSHPKLFTNCYANFISYTFKETKIDEAFTGNFEYLNTLASELLNSLIQLNDFCARKLSNLIFDGV